MKAIHQRATHHDEAAEQVADMIGRPTAQFFEFDGCIKRAAYMIEISEDTLTPIMTENSDKFERRIEKNRLLWSLL